MGKLIFVVGLTTVLFFSNVIAQSKGAGLGIIVGAPTGLTGKLWLSKENAADGAVGWSTGKNSHLYGHADYLWHNFNLFKVEKGRLPLYYGIGGRVKFDDDPKVGIRVPVGIDYLFAGVPLDIFAEIVPLLDLTPDTEFEINAAVGIRFFFRSSGLTQRKHVRHMRLTR